MAVETLADVAEIIMGQSPPGATVSADGEIPLLNGPTEFGPSHPTPTQYTSEGRKFAEPGDLLFCVRGSTTGRMNWANQRYAIGRGVAAIRHRADPDLQSLIHAILEHELPELLAQATGSTFPNVSAQQLSGLPWPELDLRDQFAVAKVLGSLNDRIELNRRMGDTLENAAATLYKSWFIDFDPVRAQARNRESLLSEHLKGIFPNSFVDSKLGPIPEGWRVSTLGEIARETRIVMQPDAIKPRTPYIALEHMPMGSIVLSEWRTADHVASDKLVFEKDQILFGKLRPYFHKVGIAPVNGVCSTDIVVVTPKTPDWCGFVLGHVSGRRFVNYADAYSTGTRMPRTNWKFMKQYEIPVPPVSVAQSFNNLIRPILQRIVATTHSTHLLSTMRDALLPGLVSGQIRVLPQNSW